jgi:hypothetical protein
MTAAVLCLSAAMSALCAAWRASTFATRGCNSISWAETSADGTGTSRIEVNREAVDGYELADAKMIDKILEVSREVGN